MSDRPSADRTAELLLRSHHEPSRYRGEARRRDATPLDAEVVLKLALGRRIEFTVAALNEPRGSEDLKAAAIAFVRNVYFHPDANPYQTLGLAPGASQEAIRESFRLLMQLVHPDRQGARKVWPDSCAAQANQAYALLRDHETREKLEREAEAQATLARAIHRAASEAGATQMPVVTWLNKRRSGRRGRKTVPRPLLPEWLTAGVGGYTRRNPAAAAFAVLVGGAMIFIGVSALDRRDGILVRGARPSHPPAEAMVATLASAPERASDTPSTPAEPVRSRRAAGSGSDIPMPAIAAVSASSAVPDAHERDAAVSPESTVSAPVPDTVPSRPARSSGQPISRQATESIAPPQASPYVAEPAARPSPPPSLAVIASAPVRQATPATDYAPVTSSGVAKVEPPTAAPEPAGTSAAMGATAPPADVAIARSMAPPARAEAVAAAPVPTMAATPPETAEIEALFASFVDSYEHGRLDAFAALFDDDADTNLRRGRSAIRGEYDELFRLSQWRRMQLNRVNWRRVGDRAIAKGEITVVIGWRDGREVVQRLNMDMELMRHDGRVVIARLTHQVRN